MTEHSEQNPQPNQTSSKAERTEKLRRSAKALNALRSRIAEDTIPLQLTTYKTLCEWEAQIETQGASRVPAEKR